jgi:hypothetical protein
VEWQAGAKVNFTLSGNSIKNTNDQVVGGTHYGGSCQVGFSTDKGKTFKVATTWQGSCPHREGTIDPATQVFDFVIPADLPAGNAVFAWTWVNREQEFNMNCASVRITGGAGGNKETTSAISPPEPPVPSTTRSHTGPQPTPAAAAAASYTLEGCSCTCPLPSFTDGCSCECENPSARRRRRLVERKALALHVEELRRKEALNVPARSTEIVAFSARPDMLFLDFDGTGCTSVGTSVELSFPDPGPDVVEGDGEYKLAPPVGNCGGGR